MNTIDKYLKHLEVEGLSESTRSAYGYQLRAYSKCLAAYKKLPKTATRADLDTYLEGIMTKGRSRSTVNWTKLVLRRFHRWLKETGQSGSDPAVDLRIGRSAQKIPEALGAKEVDRLLALDFGKSVGGLRDSAMVELLYASGLRVSEMTGLDLGDIDLQARTVKVLGKGSKERVVPFGARAAKAITAYLKARSTNNPGIGAVFLNAKGGRLNRGGVWLILKGLAKRAGIEGLHPHRLRHESATALLEGGADIRVIQRFLGHANIATTTRYAHVSPDFLRRACEKAHPGFQKA